MPTRLCLVLGNKLNWQHRTNCVECLCYQSGPDVKLALLRTITTLERQLFRIRKFFRRSVNMSFRRAQRMHELVESLGVSLLSIKSPYRLKMVMFMQGTDLERKLKGCHSNHIFTSTLLFMRETVTTGAAAPRSRAVSFTFRALVLAQGCNSEAAGRRHVPRQH